MMAVELFAELAMVLGLLDLRFEPPKPRFLNREFIRSMLFLGTMEGFEEMEVLAGLCVCVCVCVDASAGCVTTYCLLCLSNESIPVSSSQKKSRWKSHRRGILKDYPTDLSCGSLLGQCLRFRLEGRVGDEVSPTRRS